MSHDHDLSELDAIIKSFRFDMTEAEKREAIDRARLLVANMRVFLLHIVEQLGAEE